MRNPPYLNNLSEVKCTLYTYTFGVKALAISGIENPQPRSPGYQGSSPKQGEGRQENAAFPSINRGEVFFSKS
ncbi:hypothetical protein OROMI_002167 [Orobanche minor]